MQCPHCQQDSLNPTPTTTGVELDRCQECGSVWFDRGELFFFVRDTPRFEEAMNRARKAAMESAFPSPISGAPMVELTVDDALHRAYLDRQSGGVWLPGDAVDELGAQDKLRLSWSARDRGEVRRFPLPNLLARTVFTLTGLYALLTLVLIVVSLLGGMTAATALLMAAVVLAIQFLIGPFLMDLTVRWLYKARRADLGELPEHLRRYVQDTCRANSMKLPRFYIIEDLSPNAFTYGHTPNNARIALTEGMFELLEERELQGVVGHEIGHARNWDMALMTVAQLVPMVLYYLYRVALEADTDDGRAKAASLVVAMGAFVLYIISEYLVLWFSRTREYHADAFGARSVKSPAALARALVKIGYGLAGRGREEQGTGRASTVGAMGIFDGQAAQTLAVSAHADQARTDTVDAAPSRYRIDGEDLKGAMKWDLWNPWALYFELHSTHPLIAKRLGALSTQSEQMGEEPLVRFDLPQPESYWDEFLVDMAIKLLPRVCLIGAVVAALATGAMPIAGAGLVCMAAAQMIRLRFTYPTHSFPEMSVATLLRRVKVSGVRPVPCRLSGSVRGKGVPGLIWSDDFVMQDDTGILFLDHRQPLAIWEVIWGWLRGDKLIGEHVEVTGWFRRAPVPFVEIKQFTVDGVTRTSWLRHFRWGTAIMWAVVGAAVIFLG